MLQLVWHSKSPMTKKVLLLVLVAKPTKVTLLLRLTLRLVPASDKEIGGYSIQVLDVQVDKSDKSETYILTSYDDGSKWELPIFGLSLFQPSAHVFSFSLDDNKINAYRSYTATLYVSTYLNKLSELNVSNEVYFQGKTTLELIYL